MKKLMKQSPVMAILRHTPDNDLEDYVNSLYQGGLRSFEVSFSTKNAVSQLKWMKQHMPNDAYVGAGTILTEKEASIAMEAGADFLLSPSANLEVLQYCEKNKIPFLPGVFSPSDVSICLTYGFNTLKLFPAATLPIDYKNNLSGPFPGTEYVAVGGISPQNAAEYLKAGFVGLGIGSSLVDKHLFQEKNWSQIALEIQSFLDTLRKDGLL